ncbi:MAG: N-6 DNA methylase [Bacteroidales bacterium]|nr:N-6 DNA methylase [Bacteroidales bacterium]
MKSEKSIQSIEPNIADLANGWLKSYKLDYKLEQESVNAEIDKALSDYYTKNGGTGANRPDAKILIQDKNLDFYPVLIEYKGYKDKLVKLDKDGHVDNRTSKNEPNFKNINSFAVNGAVHYANALLHHTSYTDIIAIGMTGYKDETGKILHEIGVYYVSKSNLGAGQKIDDYTDFSFLAPKNFDAFIESVKTLQLSQEELDRLKEQREREIDQSLVKLNNDIYQNEKGLGENDRVYLVAASIIATLGIPGKVAPLEKQDLKSSTEKGYRDGDLMIKKIESFLSHKELPDEKRQLIVRTISNTLLTENINRVEEGESQLKRVFAKIIDDLGIYYKIGLTTDFTGKLFNEMYGWLGFSQDKLNDVVLTPSYVASLLVKLARVNKDSYVWDFATGSAGLLVAAMNEMLIDAKNTIQSPDELSKKEIHIKAEQLLGLELLSSVYMLAILNMILMGDGSSNILNTDSIKDFDGKYGFGKTDTKFPADAFILNPPYSASGNGMNFVEKALDMMNKGYAAIIIQNSTGSGKAINYNKRILSKHTLLASIKMPIDIFIGKSSVNTNVYVFKVNEKHHKDDIVKFIDFTNDGYTRSNRKKASNNLKDTGHAKERYQEVVDLVRFGKSKLKIFTEKEYYEGHIDPNNGADWNKSSPTDTKPTLEDFRKTISDYFSWEITTLLKNQFLSTLLNSDSTVDIEAAQLSQGLSDYQLTQEEKQALETYDKLSWGIFNLENLFGKSTRGKRLKSAERVPGDLPFITAGETNEGFSAYIGNKVQVFPANTTTIDMFGSAKYRNFEYGGDDHVAVVHTEKLPKYASVFVTSAIHKSSYNGQFNYGRNFYAKDADTLDISLPVKDNKPDYKIMETVISAIHKLVIKDVAMYVERKRKELNKLTENANA